MTISTSTFLGSGLTHDCNITSPRNGMLVHQNRHLSVKLQVGLPAYP